jgi:hypothetical protein
VKAFLDEMAGLVRHTFEGLSMAFPSKGDRVAHGQYGPGTITDMDIYHTVIDFDGHGPRRFVTNRVVLDRTADPGPSASEKRAIESRRVRDERKRQRLAAAARNA